ncbi:MAG: aminoglycoside phosphotransferase family enzyme/predicted kinase [Parasphingorhabdus sp.]|jgi:aminoglycoside phosphotransferase family enzyme/predicted kinase
MSEMLIKNLIESGSLNSVSPVEIVETHISWVLITDSVVYKIKKPVNLGFLDFSTLAKRKYFCEEELRLNKRFAPQLYIGVKPITGSLKRPSIGGSGPVLDYAVVMKCFDRNCELSHSITNEKIDCKMMRSFASRLSAFHKDAGVALGGSTFGSLVEIESEVMENFSQIRKRLNSDDQIPRLQFLETWTQQALASNQSFFLLRKQQGRVRECHGDLHLRNLVVINSRIIAFDCLEFSENLRWIDVASEIAFLIMDLVEHERKDLARVFLNAYLESSGDYEIMQVLRFYLLYRAMVRAKVAAISMQNTSIQDGGFRQCLDYLAFAERTIASRDEPVLVITHGLSGCGKTFVSKKIIKRVDVIQLRSDVIRKQMFEIKLMHENALAHNPEIYSGETTKLVYSRLEALTRSILTAGYSVIVDATFLKKTYREQFHRLAVSLNLSFRILSLEASEDVLRKRILARNELANDASDADLNVLGLQLESVENLDDEEQSFSVTVDTSGELTPQRVDGAITKLGLRNPNEYNIID